MIDSFLYAFDLLLYCWKSPLEQILKSFILDKSSAVLQRMYCIAEIFLEFIVLNAAAKLRSLWMDLSTSFSNYLIIFKLFQCLSFIKHIANKLRDTHLIRIDFNLLLWLGPKIHAPRARPPTLNALGPRGYTTPLRIPWVHSRHTRRTLLLLFLGLGSQLLLSLPRLPINDPAMAVNQIAWRSNVIATLDLFLQVSPI